MSNETPFPIAVFDPTSEVSIVYRRLPHWSQAGALSFITFRTFDSIPTRILKQWQIDCRNWLRQHAIDPDGDWSAGLATLDERLKYEFYRSFSKRWHDELDDCHGACVLKAPALAEIVAKSLMHFDNQRYLISDYVVMPNHVHLLVAFRDDDAMLEQCESWKHYTAMQINRALGRTGRFWQQDGFDHLIRNDDQFLRLRRYIRENPRQAGLNPTDCLHYSKRLDAK